MFTGSTLKAIRALRGVSQADLARKAGVSPTAIAEYETGKRDLRADTIRKLCDVLRVQVRVFVDQTEITEPPRVWVSRVHTETPKAVIPVYVRR